MTSPGVLDIREVVTAARDEARALGSSRIEAEHLLLALAARPRSSAGQVLNDAGLDPAAIRGALDLEFAHSLGTMGISLHGFALPDARLSVLGALPLSRSAKLALQRAIQARHRAQPRPPARFAACADRHPLRRGRHGGAGARLGPVRSRGADRAGATRARASRVERRHARRPARPARRVR